MKDTSSPNEPSKNIWLSDKDIGKRFNVSRKSPWAWAADEDNDFPKPVKFSGKCTRWRLSDIVEWEAKKGGGV